MGNSPFLLAPIKHRRGLIHKKENHIMLVNNQSSVISLSLVFNKGAVKESSKRGGDVMITSIHNGSITCAYDTSKYFAQFRLVSEKQGEVPMFVKGGSKLKPTEQQISAKTFLDLFYGGESTDTKFYVNLTEEICEAINDTSCKSIKLTFLSSSITERKEEEYKGGTSLCFYIENVEVETLESYFGIGRKVDADHIASCIEQALEQSVAKKTNIVTGEELKEKADKLSKSSKKKLIREVEEAILKSTQEGLLEEFKSVKFSSEPGELQTQLEVYKEKAKATSQVSAVEQSLRDEVEEVKELSKEEQANFLMSLLD